MKKIYLLLLLVAGFVNAQIVNIPDANFKSKLLSASPNSTIAYSGTNKVKIDINGDGEIQNTEAAVITALKVSASSITDLTGVEAFTGLTKLECNNNQISVLNLSALSNLTYLNCTTNLLADLSGSLPSTLTYLDCSSNGLTTFDLSALTNLLNLNCNNNNLSALDVSALVNLQELSFGANEMTAIDVTPLLNLTKLNCAQSLITSIDISTLVNLEYFNFSGTFLTSIDLENQQNLTSLFCAGSGLNALDISALANLANLDCSHNNLTALDVSHSPNLFKLKCDRNQLTALDVSGLATLREVNCEQNDLIQLLVNGCTSLRRIICGGNALPTLDASNLPQLREIHCTFNSMTTLNIDNTVHLWDLDIVGNPLTSIDLSPLTELQVFRAGFNLFTVLDLSHCPLTGSYQYSDENIIMNFHNSFQSLPNLQILNLKNGSTFNHFGVPYNPQFLNVPNLRYICIDNNANEIAQILPQISPSVIVNSYCSFNPGGDYNTITGGLTFDYNNDGCDDNDLRYPYLKVVINDGAAEGSTFTNASGNYTFYTPAGTFNAQPQLEQPNYFSVSPTVATLNFPLLDNSVQTQNFCISGVGLHPDLEIVLTPLQAARPGFDVDYAITYRNKGNQSVSGAVSLAFDDDHANFTASNPTADNQQINSLGWNFANLQPFETRSIHFTLRLNSTVNTPALNSGDTLHFTSTITFFEGDETPADNSFELHQLVVNSYDPNDKTCLEGTNVLPENIGKYLHYNINFENTGTADAINVVVKDTIDTTRFDINSLQLLYASHPVYPKITGNVVEFIFEGINLPPSIANPIGGHGNVLFKIKTLPTLTVGDEVSNTANIFFDYNAPIDTNEARTAFNNLSKSDFVKDNSVTVYPNPAKNKVTVKATGTIKSVQLYDVQGRILQTIIEDKNQVTIDLSMQLTGIYFVTVTTLQGSSTQKIIKQ